MNTKMKIFHWVPRIICILAILMVSMFALDSFSGERTFMQNLGAFLKHLIPSFMLLAFLVFAWKYEFIGGIIFILIGLGFSPFIYNHNYQMNHSVGMSLGIILIVTLPFIIVGVLFIISHRLKSKQLKN